ncbi:glycosyltransferase [Gloeobacter kilaueensis]|uniref:Glycosyl transferase group 1 n=1 Tax=Gloeobacter kilaueensis (strain ATCC BAA-2537 / CCAP 1431/1 / ULC 316 / JS1) TaxID=1183438 RepID=U5QHT3_GLOK1|nr:glycosyltransferase [Gloeobacter kilaueensis]AGY57189.1 glycosyl transferase group 1 [Gloeobacter kilaueensis JS1]
MRILTWHVHGSYLYNLAHVPCQWLLPVRPGRPEGYGGRASREDWPGQLIEIDAKEVRHTRFDGILFQSRRNWEVDQYELLSAAQRRLPRFYLEHDPPREHPTDTRHPVDDPGVVLVHVTPFNALMWDSGRTPTRIIDHGVAVPPESVYSGELERGLVVLNGLAHRGRRLGADIFERVRRVVPLDLVGMGSEELGGLGEIDHRALAAFACRYRFFFHPVRYTSLGLAVIEAMLLALPVVALATTELVTAIENGRTGYLDTDIDRLIVAMRRLLADPEEARRVGAAGREAALARFGIERFVADWQHLLAPTPLSGQRK